MQKIKFWATKCPKCGSTKRTLSNNQTYRCHDCGHVYNK